MRNMKNTKNTKIGKIQNFQKLRKSLILNYAVGFGGPRILGESLNISFKLKRACIL
jgi:hypothetical protein